MYMVEPVLQMGRIVPASCRVYIGILELICQEPPVSREPAEAQWNLWQRHSREI